MVEKALDVAQQLVKEQYPDCLTAILAGSIVRGEGTDHSDLDVIIIDPRISHPYRESFYYHGFPVEVFVHTRESYQDYFKSDGERARPSLPQMVAEGIVLVNHEISIQMVQEAKILLKSGPTSWTNERRQSEQYGLTDLLDDFEGSMDSDETIFIAGKLAEKTHEFYLRTHHQWIGSGKWVLRALKRYDSVFAERFVEAFRTFYETGEKPMVIELVDGVLQPFGGRLFEGFSNGKEMEK